MNRSLEGKIKINTFADIVGGEEDTVTEIELTELHPFKTHPFKVLDDDRMMEMAESIRKDKVWEPGLVRPLAEGGYEIIAGHRRKRACELAGRKTMPVIIREMDDDDATMAMIDTNLRIREELLPSEKAYAYKMKLEVISHQGKETSRQVGEKLGSAEKLGKNSGDSERQVHRYIRLTELKKELLDIVDAKKLKFNPAVELSYLTGKQQEILQKVMKEDSVLPSLAQAQQLRQLAQDGAYTRESVHAILAVAPIKERRFTIGQDVIYRYFDPDTSDEDIEKTICSLLDEWQRNGGKL